MSNATKLQYETLLKAKDDQLHSDNTAIQYLTTQLEDRDIYILSLKNELEVAEKNNTHNLNKLIGFD